MMYAAAEKTVFGLCTLVFGCEVVRSSTKTKAQNPKTKQTFDFN